MASSPPASPSASAASPTSPPGAVSADRVLDAARLDALRRTGLLDSETEECFDRLARLAQRLTGAPVVLLSLVDERRQYFKSALGLAEDLAATRETPLSHSFCKYVVRSGQALVVEDARQHALVRDNPAVTEMGVAAYAGVPVSTPEGHTLGTFCAVDFQPRAWSETDLQVLQDIASAATAEIELRLRAQEAARDAARAETERQQKEAMLQMTNEGVLGLDGAGRCTFANDSAARLLGLPSPEGLIGQALHAVVHPPGICTPPCTGETCSLLGAIGKVPRAIHHQETQVYRADGTCLPVLLSVRPLPPLNGQAGHGRSGNGHDGAAPDAPPGFVVSLLDDSDRQAYVRRLRVQHAVSSTLAAPGGAERGPLARLLGAIGRALGWDVAAFWQPAPEAPGRLVRTDDWHAPGFDGGAFLAESPRELSLDTSVAGAVFREGTPRWLANIQLEPAFARAAQARQASLRGALFLPVLSGERVLGVAEFMSTLAQPPDPLLLDTLAGLGEQIGSFLERRRAEARARSSEARKAAIMDVSLDAFIIIDADGTVLEWNPAAEQVLGYSHDEAVGRPMAELIVPERMREQHHRAMRRYLDEGIPSILNTRFEIQALCKDGSEVPVELAVTRVGTEEPAIFLGTLRDIRAQKAAAAALQREREQFEQLVETLPHLIWTARPDGSLEFFNGRLLTYFDRTRESLSGWSWTDVIHPDDLARTLARWQHSLDTEEPYEIEFRLRRHDGVYRWHLARAIPIRDADGSIRQWFGSNTDITDHKRTALDLAREKDRLAELLGELQATQRQLVQQEKLASLGRLTAGVAHEIKNPLNFVINFAELALQQAEELRQITLGGDGAAAAADPEDLADLLDDLVGNTRRIAQHGRRADGIVRAMLAHARSRPDAPAETDLNALLRESVDLAYHGLRVRRGFSVALEYDLDPELPPQEAIAESLGRALLNLAGNALDALLERSATEGPSFAPRLRVTSRRTAEGAQISVEDNGTGMPDDVAARIFEPFFTTKAAGRGIGLGLSLAYDAVVQEHGGTLRVKTAPGQGTCFTLELPRRVPRQKPLADDEELLFP
ncbi:MAG: PAS domain S-box protein [Rubricoccaceae bacterium]